MCCAASGLPIRPGAGSATARLGPVLGAFCKQLVSPAEPLPWVASVIGGGRQALEPVSQLFANVESLSLCPSVHPSVYLRCGGGAWSLLLDREMCVEIMGWREWWGEGFVLKTGSDWDIRVRLGSREVWAMTPGPGAGSSLWLGQRQRP